MKPVALVTGELSPYREEPFRLLDEAERVEVLPFREHGERAVARRVASGRYRAVIAGLGGRVALPGSYLAARRARIPFVLWASLWGHPRTPAHALSYLPTVLLYRNADAVVTYGSHVSRYVERFRTGNVYEAPQAATLGPVLERPPHDGFRLLFVGRLEREKGLGVLLDAWRRAGLGDDAELVVAGAGPLRAEGRGVRALGAVERAELPHLYASADALVLPSVRTATFLEPWGLVINEAMRQGTPAIATDAVGAVAGGLVRDGRNGLVAPAGDAGALASRIRTLAMNPDLRGRLSAAAREDVEAFSEEAWVDGMRRALRAVGASLRPHMIRVRHITTTLVALCALGVFAPSAYALDDNYHHVIRECYDTGRLDGSKYTREALKKARRRLPSDIKEYSDCEDLINEALANYGRARGGSGGGGAGYVPPADPALTTPSGAVATSRGDYDALARETDPKLRSSSPPAIPIANQKLTPTTGGVINAARGTNSNDVPLPLIIALAALAAMALLGGVTVCAAALAGDPPWPATASSAASALLGAILAGVAFGATGGVQLDRVAWTEIVLVLAGGVLVAVGDPARTAWRATQRRVDTRGVRRACGARGGLGLLVERAARVVARGEPHDHLHLRVRGRGGDRAARTRRLGDRAASDPHRGRGRRPLRARHAGSSRARTRPTSSPASASRTATGTRSARRRRWPFRAALWLGARRSGFPPVNALAYPLLALFVVTIFLSYSRAAVVVAGVGALAWVAFVPLRLRSITLLSVALAGSAPVIVWALQKDAFTENAVPIEVREAVATQFGLFILATIIVDARRRPRDRLPQRPPARLGAVTRLRVGLAAGVVAIAVPIALSVVLANSDRGLSGTIKAGYESLTSTSSKTGSGPSRLLSASSSRGTYWHQAKEVFQSHYWKGTGANSFGVARLRYREPNDQSVSQHAHGYAHQTGADLGIAGLAASLALLAGVARRGGAGRGPASAAAAAGRRCRGQPSASASAPSRSARSSTASIRRSTGSGSCPGRRSWR